MVSTRRASKRQETPSTASVSTPTTNVSPFFSTKTSVASETPVTSEDDTKEIKVTKTVKTTKTTQIRRSARGKRARQDSSEEDVSPIPAKKRLSAIKDRVYVEISVKNKALARKVSKSKRSLQKRHSKA